jgi:hypothetical protein
VPTEFDTDEWPFVPAKSSHAAEGKRKVRLIVIHSMEAPETSTAESVMIRLNRAPAPTTRLSSIRVRRRGSRKTKKE